MPKHSSNVLSQLDHNLKNSYNYLQQRGLLPAILSGAATLGIALVVLLSLNYLNVIQQSTHPSSTNNNPNANNTPPNEDTSNSPDTTTPDSTTPTFIDLQPTVDAWLKTTTANVGLMIYDIDNDRVAASHNANTVFNVASIYKLFFVYDGYRQLENGTITDDVTYVTTTDYRAGSYTFSECLDLMIRESYNGCADYIRDNPYLYNRAENLIQDLGLTHTSAAGLDSSAADLTKLLKLYYEHPDLSNTSWQKIADSMLNQPPTKVADNQIYDWRQGLPAGFSSKALVYNKVGWSWNNEQNTWTTYADAAIIEFPELNRHYTVVVLTSNLPSKTPTALINLGTRIEDAIIAATAKL